MNKSFNDRLRQLMLLALIILVSVMITGKLLVFLPGLLGGITLYILTFATYNKLIYEKKWKKGLTAILFILVSLIIISIPVYFAIKLISPVINRIMQHPEKIVEGLRQLKVRMEDYFGRSLLSENEIISFAQKVSSSIPRLINSTLNLIANLIMMFFLYYYLLVNGKSIEATLRKMIPLKPDNVSRLASETNLLIRANALGIPLISFVQGVFAALGFWIFGVENWAMWGFFSAVFAFFPLVGTMLVWVPLALLEFIAGNNGMAIGLVIYNVIVTGNVDYITRLLFMKKMGNIHPMITIFGVIAGLGLFGFMGLIFGPLLVSYLLIMVRIYVNEFTSIPETDSGPDVVS